MPSGTARGPPWIASGELTPQRSSSPSKDPSANRSPPAAHADHALHQYYPTVGHRVTKDQAEKEGAQGAVGTQPAPPAHERRDQPAEENAAPDLPGDVLAAGDHEAE